MSLYQEIWERIGRFIYFGIVFHPLSFLSSVRILSLWQSIVMCPSVSRSFSNWHKILKCVRISNKNKQTKLDYILSKVCKACPLSLKQSLLWWLYATAEKRVFFKRWTKTSTACSSTYLRRVQRHWTGTFINMFKQWNKSSIAYSLIFLMQSLFRLDPLLFVTLCLLRRSNSFMTTALKVLL